MDVVVGEVFDGLCVFDFLLCVVLVLSLFEVLVVSGFVLFVDGVVYDVVWFD